MPIINSLPFTLVNSTVADATQVMANFNQIVANANSNAAHSGANNDITALLALATALSPSQGGSNVFIGSPVSGINTILVSSTVPGVFTNTAGYSVIFVATGTNTGATTVSVNAQPAKNISKPGPGGPIALTGGEIVTGNLVQIVYDGTQFILLNNNLSLLGPLTNLASAATADLGTIPSHVVNITGVTTITSFGASASATFPIYVLKFAGILTLTYNAVSLLLPGKTNILTAVNDYALALYLGAGNWQILDYVPTASFLPLNTTPSAQAAGITVGLADRGKVFRFSGLAADAVIALPTAVTALNGFEVSFSNEDTTDVIPWGIIVTPNLGAGNLLDGFVSRKGYMGTRVTIVCDGTNWFTKSGRWRFFSGNQTISAAGALVLAHNLGVRPKTIMSEAKCLVAEYGYSIGDIMNITQSINIGGNVGVSIVLDATNLNVRFGNYTTTFTSVNKNTGIGVGLTNANWAFRIFAEE